MVREFPSRIISSEVAAAGLLSGPGILEDSYVVPADRVLRVDLFGGGCEYSTRDVRIELVWRSGGSDVVIVTGYALGSVFRISPAKEVVGDGSAQLVLRLVNGSNSVLHMTGEWAGTLLEG